MRYVSRHTVRRWWPGLLLLAPLFLVAAWHSTAVVERHLKAAATPQLDTPALSKGSIDIAGRDVRLNGLTFSEDSRRHTVSAVETVRGVRKVIDNTRRIPEFSPYVWKARREGDRLILEGAVPGPVSRGDILEIAKALPSPGEIVDQMEYGRGAPKNFTKVAMVLVEQLGRLSAGEVAIENDRVRVTGRARELGGREMIWAEMKRLSDGFVLDRADITAPPYGFQAVKDPVGGTITLSGVVPDDSTRRALLADVAAMFFNEKIVDKLAISLGAPDQFGAVAALALARLSRLSTGSLDINDTTVKLSGDALYGMAAEQIRDLTKSKFAKGWKIETDITVKPAAAHVDASVCQQLFNDLLGRTSVRFKTASATLDPASTALLDQLVITAMRCPSTRIVVAGHTDSDGDATTNVHLSERRASAVVAYLTQAGVPAEQLKAVGFGASQPVASNDSDEGKAQNRRIQFVVE